jgi:hypothetical protein
LLVVRRNKSVRPRSLDSDGLPRGKETGDMLAVRQYAVASRERPIVSQLFRRIAFVAGIIVAVVIAVAAPTYLVTAAFGWPPMIRLGLAGMVTLTAVALLLAIADEIERRPGA